MPKATGTFEVKLETQPLHTAASDLPLGRRSIAKSFKGDLVATSRGEMLSAMGTVTGSAGYVALECVEGVLEARSGTFALQHFGVMDRGTPSLRVSVVPDSGTGDLKGLRGTMEILVEKGQHRYVFDYEWSL